MTLGTRLRLLRAAVDMTQAELARRCGTDRASVSTIEADRREPRSRLRKEIAAVLQVPEEALVDDVACIHAVSRLVGVEPARLGTAPAAKPPDPPRVPGSRSAALASATAALAELRAEFEEKIEELRAEMTSGEGAGRVTRKPPKANASAGASSTPIIIRPLPKK